MKFLTKGDINGFFGLFINNMANLLVLTSLLLYVVGFPKDVVYGYILPGLGIAILFVSIMYGKLAFDLQKKNPERQVTALPSGLSVPHMYLIVFVVLGPVYWKTGDVVTAWSAAITWCFIEGLVELSGAVFGKKLKSLIPRPALLGSLAGVSLTFILLNPAFSIFSTPYIGVVALVFVLIAFVGNEKMPFGIPAGLLIVIFGMVVGWTTGYMSFDALKESLNSTAIYMPKLGLGRIIDGITLSKDVLLLAIPFGVYNFIETIDNVESAETAGDKYNLTQVLVVDGVGSIISSLFCSAFPVAVYIGHPGWKSAGAGIWYSTLSGVVIFLLVITGTLDVLMSLIPVVSLEPILIFIGIMITTQAFDASERKYFPAVVVAFIPWLADWSQNIFDIALNSVNTVAVDAGLETIKNSGVNYVGMMTLGAGSIIVSILWSVMTIFIIDKEYKKLVVVALVGSVLTLAGMIHKSEIENGLNIEMIVTYLAAAAIFIVFHFKNKLINNKREN